MGALGGGVSGGFGDHAAGVAGGHSTLGNTSAPSILAAWPLTNTKLAAILGVVGGAFAGHKLEDGVEDWKDDRDEKKKAEKRREEERQRREGREWDEEKWRYDKAQPSSHHAEQRRLRRWNVLERRGRRRFQRGSIRGRTKPGGTCGEVSLFTAIF
jgi:hypothetical protein